jgi:hypothetical protein
VHSDVPCRIITDSDDPAMILMLTAANASIERVAELGGGAHRRRFVGRERVSATPRAGTRISETLWCLARRGSVV